MLVHAANTDKAKLSCLVLSMFVVWTDNWWQVKTVCDWKFRSSFVQSRNAVCESCLALTQFPICNVVTYCDVIFGNWVTTSSQMRSHRRQDWTKLFSLHMLKTVCDCCELSSHCWQDKTVVLSMFAVWTSHRTQFHYYAVVCLRNAWAE